MENSQIEWCHHTANLWHGCMEVHEGCDNCYARQMNNRYHHEKPHWGGKVPRLIIKKTMNDLAIFQKKAADKGEIHRVFVGSMMDIFEKPMPLVDGNGDLYKNINTDVLREELFANISLGFYPNLLFLLLTKRPSNINKYIPEQWKINGAPKNVMFGTSVVNQETADKMIPELLQVNGYRFLSCEPLLGPIKLSKTYCLGCKGDLEKRDCGCPAGSYQKFIGDIDWVICGGESGHNARPMHPDWARSLRDQCKAAGVPYLFKQWGEYRPYSLNPVNEPIPVSAFQSQQKIYRDGEFITVPGDMSVNNAFKDFVCFKVGKKAAGAVLDFKEYKEFPII